MSFSKEEYLDLFNEHLSEFVIDIAKVFKEDKSIQLLKEGILLAIEINKSRCIKGWTLAVCNNFRQEIANNDFNFFIEKKDWENIVTHQNKDYILVKINELRNSVRDFSYTNKKMALKYVENLIKLADLYNSSTTI